MASSSAVPRYDGVMVNAAYMAIKFNTDSARNTEILFTTNWTSLYLVREESYFKNTERQIYSAISSRGSPYENFLKMLKE